MLNQQYVFTKLRTEIEEKKRKIYQKYRKFGYLAYNSRNKKEAKGKLISQNRFEVIVGSVMQCRVKEKVKVKKQEIVKKGIQCFRCWGIGYYK